MSGARHLIPVADRLGLSRDEAAQYIGISPSYWDMMVKDGRMPAPKRLGSRTIWDRRAIERAFSELPNGWVPNHAGEGVDPYADTAA